MVSLGDVWEARLRWLKLSNPVFELFKNKCRNRSLFYRFWEPKCSPNPSPNHQKSIHKTIQKPYPEKQHKLTETNPAKPCKSSWRAGVVLFFTRPLFPKSYENNQKHMPKQFPKSLNINKKGIQKSNQKTHQK